LTRQIRTNWELRGPELLVGCYLRLNGYFVVNNFILHEEHGSQKTEIDLIGVRFPNQIEIINGNDGLAHTLENDDELVIRDNLIDVVIAEVTTGPAKINDPFQKEEVLEYVLDWIGCLDEAEKREAIKALRNKQDFCTDKFRVRFVCFGKPSKIECKQLTLLHVLTFIRGRFKKYYDLKTQSRQWYGVMDYLYTTVNENTQVEKVLDKIIKGDWKLKLG
jgi:hypothetical protein